MSRRFWPDSPETGGRTRGRAGERPATVDPGQFGQHSHPLRLDTVPRRRWWRKRTTIDDQGRSGK